ncbi:MAG TPA: hypothetical protein VLJ19_15355 [Variovorax sp.]|nr:hypothetical protein [Variovorax sp.]
MNNVCDRTARPARPAPSASGALASVVLATACLAAWAGPGAHGPGGEHLDTPAAAGAGAGWPRVEAKSELFELVATLRGGELSVLIDRFATNEPVLNAQVEVESGALKAKATFHSDIGDYAVDDPAFLKALATPGEHALVVTVVAGNESDLLDGTLVIAAALASGNDDEHGAVRALGARPSTWAAAAVVGTTLIAAFAWWRRRRHAAATLKGAL